MSYNPLWQLQNSLCNYLENDLELKQNINGIYTYMPPNVTWPCIYIGKAEIYDWSCPNLNGFNIISELQIYTKEKSTKNITTISSRVMHRLKEADLKLANYHLININLLSCYIHTQSDNSYKSVIRFKVVLQEKGE